MFCKELLWEEGYGTSQNWYWTGVQMLTLIPNIIRICLWRKIYVLKVNHSCYAGQSSEFSKKILPIFYMKVNFFVLLGLLRDDQMIFWQPEKVTISFSQGSFLLSKPAIFTKAWCKAFTIPLWIIIIFKMPFVTPFSALAAVKSDLVWTS